MFPKIHFQANIYSQTTVETMLPAYVHDLRLLSAGYLIIKVAGDTTGAMPTGSIVPGRSLAWRLDTVLHTQLALSPVSREGSAGSAPGENIQNPNPFPKGLHEGWPSAFCVRGPNTLGRISQNISRKGELSTRFLSMK